MLFFGYKTRKERIIRDIIFLALGVLFLFFPESWFSGAVILFSLRLIGAILILLGGLEVFVLIGAMSITRVGLTPVLLAVGTLLFGFTLLFMDGDGHYFWIKLIAGIGLLWYGISDLISGWKIGKAYDEYEIHRTKQAPEETPQQDGFTVGDLGDVKEVDYRKED